MDSFQDAIPRNHCFGCGPLNPNGLRIESRWRESAEGDGARGDDTRKDGARGDSEGSEARTAVCRWRPESHHVAGPTNVVNGGILATVIDCHAVCTAIADAYERAGRALGEGEEIWYATGELRVRYLAPAPMGTDLELEARVLEAGERTTRLACTVSAAGRARAEAEVVAVRVPAAWRDAPAA